MAISSNAAIPSAPGGPARRRVRRVLAVALVAVVLAALAACSGDSGPTVTVYSGRSTELIKPLLDDFAEQSGISVEFKTGDSADLALTIDQEGDASPADVFISQSPGATAFLAQQGRLSPLPEDVLAAVPPELSGADGEWVGLTARVRVLVYNTDLVEEADLPASVLDTTDERYAGQIAVAPTNGSFQDFVSALRVAEGDEAAQAWLEGMEANGAPTYANNNAIVDAVIRGEVPMGLVNHYYLQRRLAEDPDAPAVNHFFGDGDVGSVLLVTAAGILDTAPHRTEAEELLRFLVSPEAQQYFADTTQEYPLIEGVEPDEGLPPLDEVVTDRVDFAVLGTDLESTLEMIRASGLSS